MVATKAVLLASATVLAVSSTWRSAEAAYAFASNQITSLSLTYATGTPLSNIGIATTSVNDSANFAGFPSAANGLNGLVGSPLNIAQATAGPGPFPGENFFTQSPGITGSRSDASISGGGAGTVSVSNVAEAGNGTGTAQAGNDATVSFTVVGADQQLLVTFSDLYQLVATSSLGQTATATISNSFRIVGGGLDFAASPAAINATVGSANGVPPTDTIGPISAPFSILSPLLTEGVAYTVTLTSQARASIIEFAVPAPEPASMALLGAGLLGLGVIRRRRGQG